MARRLLAELVGTFVLVFGGVGSAVFAGKTIGALGVSLAFGVALVAMVYALGPVSGCHVNPAVTLGMWLRGRIEAKTALGYFVVQIIGAILASVVLMLVAQDVIRGQRVDLAGLGANGFGRHSPGHYGLVAALAVEGVSTFILVMTVLGATSRDASPGFAGLAAGLALTLGHLLSIPVTNASMNPARSIGPALIMGDWALAQLWVFIAAPLAGGVLAALVDALLRASSAKAMRLEERPTVPFAIHPEMSPMS